MKAQLHEMIQASTHIVVMQADNPDADSLASALALESMLSDMGKTVSLYCGVEIPTYLHYIRGWDRVEKRLPPAYDAAIIVDASALVLFEQLQKSAGYTSLQKKPVAIIDHHTAGEPSIPFADIYYFHPAVAAGELLYEVSNALGWKRSSDANELIAISILSDSLGLTSEGTTARSIHIIAELVEQGVRIPNIEEARRSLQKKSPEILAYKGQLLSRVEYVADGRIAFITIPWDEIEQYSSQYNPSMLVLDEMRMVEGVELAVSFKTYPDGKVTAKIRSNYRYGVSAQLATHFGGGGHPYAAGFKQTGKPFNQIKSECLAYAAELLDTLKGQDNDTPTQYAYTVS